MSEHFLTSSFNNGSAVRDLGISHCTTDLQGALTSSYAILLWGFVKDSVYVPPLQRIVDELRRRMTQAMAAVTPRVWDEFDYRLGVW